jgi:hypothetical protein
MSLSSSGAEPQPSLAWTFESSYNDIVTNLAPASVVSPGPAQLVGGAALVTDAPSDAATVLLLHFDGNFTDSSIYSKTIANSGSVVTSGTAKQFGTASMYTPGTAGNYYLSTTATNLMFGTSDFTIEFWMNPVVLTTQRLMGNLPLGSFNSGAWAMGFNTANSGKFHIDINNFGGLKMTTAQTVGSWYHIALVRSGTSWYLYQNGVREATAISSASFDNGGAARPVYIGWSGYSTSLAAEYFNGYLDEIRFTTGKALYTTATFPVPANAFTVINNPPYSVSFPGSVGAYMNLGTSSPAIFSLQTSNIFVEAWINLNNLLGSVNMIIQNGIGGGQNWGFWVNNTGVLTGFIWGLVGGVATVIQSTTSGITAGAWYHVAFSFDSIAKSTRIYINGGNPVTVTNETVTPTYNTSLPIWMGNFNNSNYFNGYIRDLRVVRGGVVPTASFTPGAAPFSYASPTYVANMGTTVFTLLGQFITYNPSGKYGSAISVLTGSLTYSTSLVSNPTTTGFTVSSWINSQSSINLNSLLYIGGTLAVQVFGNNLLVQYNDTGQNPAGTNGIQIYTGQPLTVGTWYHVSVVIGTSRVITVYLNGTQFGSQPTIVSPVSLAGSIVFCYSYNGYGSGLFDDLRIYNSALTAAQVRSVYSSQGAPAPSRAMPTPRLAWNFDGTTAEYIVNKTTTVRSGWTPTYGTGKYNKSLIFANSVGVTPLNDLRCSFPWTVNISQGFTIAFWVKINVLNGSYIIHMGNTGAWGINLMSTGVHYIDENGTYPYNSQNYNFVVGQWCHVVLSIGGAVTYYKNGTILGAPISYVARSASVLQNQFWIGTDEYSGFNGELDDLRIYDKALTSIQVMSVYKQNGMPGRGIMVKSPIQPGYIYDLNNNTTNIGTPNVIIINASNPDPRNYLSGDTSRITQWNSVPNLLTLWDTTPFKYYMMFLVGGYTYPLNIPVNGIYNIDVLFVGPGGNSDSFLISIDSDVATIATTGSTSFIWLTARTNTLTAGSHTIQITAREPSGLAAIRVIPMGGAAPTLNAFRQQYTGTPLFSQLSTVARSSVVGAFSLRAVNGITAKAVQVRRVPSTAGTNAIQFSIIGNQFSHADTSIAPPDTSTAGQVTYNGTTQYTRINSLNLTPATTGMTISLHFKLNSVASGQYIIKMYDSSFTNSAVQFYYNGTGIVFTITANSTTYYPGTYTATSGVNYYIVMIFTGTIVYIYINNVLWTTTTLGQSLVNNSSYTLWGLGSYNGGGYTSMTVYDFRIMNTVLVSSDIVAQDFYTDRKGNLSTKPIAGQFIASWLNGSIGYVSKWYDQSGAENHASQSTAANQPIIQKATKGAGYSCVFNGANSHVLRCAPSTYSLLNGTKYTVVINERRNTSADGGYFGVGTTGVSGTGLIAGYFGTNNIVYTHRGDNLDNTIPAYAGVSEPIRHTTYVYSASSPNKRVYINGSQLTNTNNSYDLIAPSGEFTIGKSFGTGNTNYYYGEIYELLVFTKSLYDLDNTGGLINQIYNNQLSSYGT